MARFAIALLFLAGAGCAPSSYWFESDSWFSEPPLDSDAPSYIPIAAVPPSSELPNWSQKDIKKKREQLRQKIEGN